MNLFTLRRVLCLCLAVLPFLVVASPAADTKKLPPIGTIERKDPALDKLIPKDAVVENLADGFDWAEGPIFVPDGKYLLFSDIPKNTIWKWKEGDGITKFLQPSGDEHKNEKLKEPGSNGLTLDPEGRLVACDHGERRVYRLEKDGKTKTVLADKYEGKRFNSPNDLVYTSKGDLYFTDPPYGLMLKTVEGKDEFPGRELDFCGVYRLSKDGKLTLLTKEMSKPNGLAFSPDEKTLYVANSDPKKAVWMSYPVKADGTLGEGKVFFDSTDLVATKKGLPDGMKVDVSGNLWATGPGGIFIFSPEGKHLGTLATGVATANCNWGDDGSTLYIAADKNLGRIKLTTKGKLR
jgi:gluconolactonase